MIPGADSLWALEQALKSGHVGALVAWLPPRLRAERLRRLQLAAQAHDGPAFVMRELEARHRPTAAPLRLPLRPGGGDRCCCACSSAAARRWTRRCSSICRRCCRALAAQRARAGSAPGAELPTSVPSQLHQPACGDLHQSRAAATRRGHR